MVFLLVTIGLIIVGLSLLDFMLNFQVLIAQASHDIRLLIQLGYRDQQITQALAKNLLQLFGVVVLAVLVSLVPLKYWLSLQIMEQGYQLSTILSPLVWITGLLFCILFVGINISSIQKNVRNLA